MSCIDNANQQEKATNVMLSACWNRDGVSLKQKVLIGIRCLYQHAHSTDFSNQTTILGFSNERRPGVTPLTEGGFELKPPFQDLLSQYLTMR